jgi:predicted ATPase/DNA-binding NarL/FixJ family response regulator
MNNAVEHRLPHQLTPFVGRDAELTEITRLLSEPACRLLTLMGPGGMGKTRLAIEAVRWLTTSPYPAAEEAGMRAYFVALQPITSPDLIVSTIAEALNYNFHGELDPKTQLLNYLGEKSLLLVLDNFEHLLEGADLLSEILEAAPAVKLLVTSRERLNLREEWVLEVGGLTYPAAKSESDFEHYSAIELFVQHARRVSVGFKLLPEQRPALIQICRLVGGMPLALELAASWVRVMPCGEIAAEIERSLDILTTTVRNIPEKHRSMAAAFDHSWMLLSADERAVFRKISLFRGGFTREAAEAVAGASLKTLAVLVDKSLLRVDGSGRYDLHELLRQYAEEQLQLSGEMESARDAHSAYYAAFLHQRWQAIRSHQQVKTLDEIEAEFANMRTAWLTMVEKKKIHELRQAAYSLWLFADLRGRFYEAAALFKQAGDALRPALGDVEVDRVVGQMLALRGWFSVDLMMVEQGRILAQEGLSILQRVGSPEDVALAHHGLCNIEAHVGDGPALKWNGEQIAEIARRIDDRWLLAAAHFSMTNAALLVDDFERARRTGQAGLELAEICGDLFLRAMFHAMRGSMVRELGDHAEAKQHFEQALKLLEELGQDSTIGSCHHELGLTAFFMKDYSHAVFHYQYCLRVFADMGGREHYLFSPLLSIAQLWVAVGRNEKAVELLTFVVHHPKSYEPRRVEAERILRPLQAQLPSQAFAEATECGYRLELDALVQELITELSQLASEPVAAVAPTASQLLADPLTERELEILQLIAAGLNTREVAQRLYLSVSTVRWYMKQIYVKLDAHSRVQVITRARELKLLA